jgi:hypothetical protein
MCLTRESCLECGASLVVGVAAIFPIGLDDFAPCSWSYNILSASSFNSSSCDILRSSSLTLLSGYSGISSIVNSGLKYRVFMSVLNCFYFIAAVRINQFNAALSI